MMLQLFRYLTNYYIYMRNENLVCDQDVTVLVVLHSMFF